MTSEASVRHRRPRHRRRWTVGVLIGIAAIVVFVTAWVGIRGLIAKDQLEGAVPIATAVRTELGKSDLSHVSDQVAEIEHRASTAAELTSDPVWRACELIPGIGPNLLAFRQASAVIDQVSQKALPPLMTAAGKLSPGSFSIAGGRIDVSAITAAEPLITAGDVQLARATSDVDRIDTSVTVGPVRDAVSRLADLVHQTHDAVDGLRSAATLLAPMLGAQGPRSYLLMSLNNAELRASGGIPGALAVLSVDNGKISLTGTGSASGLGVFSEPVLPLSSEEQKLYGTIPGLFMQDVTMTPDFPRSAQLAREMWRVRTGQTVDGVLAVDPVALGYVLGAVGSVDAGGGVTLDSQNAASFLLNRVYFEVSDPRQQDEFFSHATGSILSKLTGGSYDKGKLLAALSKAVSEGRLKVWSDVPNEEGLLARSQLGGTQPPPASASTPFGVYLNDGTGAKMDYYLRMGLSTVSAQCTPSGDRRFGMRIDLSSTVADSAVKGLPAYVSGGGFFGVTPGRIATNVHIYAPAGSVPTRFLINGVASSFAYSPDRGSMVLSTFVELSPLERSEIEVVYAVPADSPDTFAVDHTPMSSPVDVSTADFAVCG